MPYATLTLSEFQQIRDRRVYQVSAEQRRDFKHRISYHNGHIFKRNKTLKDVFDALLGATKKFGLAFPTIGELVRWTEKSERSVHRAIAKIASWFNIIRVVDQYGRNLFNAYIPKYDELNLSLPPKIVTMDDTPGGTLQVAPPEERTSPDSKRDEPTKIDPISKSLDLKDLKDKKIRPNYNKVAVQPSPAEIPDEIKPHLENAFSRQDVQQDLWKVTKIVAGESPDPAMVKDAVQITACKYWAGELTSSIASYFRGVLAGLLKNRQERQQERGQQQRMMNHEVELTADQLRSFFTAKHGHKATRQMIENMVRLEIDRQAKAKARLADTGNELPW